MTEIAYRFGYCWTNRITVPIQDAEQTIAELTEQGCRIIFCEVTK